MTTYSDSLFTRDEINAARPMVSTLAGFPLAQCLSIREGFTNSPLIIDYRDLYALRFYEKPYLPGMLLTMRGLHTGA